MRDGITAEGVSPAILTAQACCGVGCHARRRFHSPSVAAPTAATRTATGSHSRRCFAAIRDGPGLPHGRFGKIRPSARVAAVAVPYGHRRSLAAAASVSASLPARFLAGSLRAYAHAAVFMSPVWQPPSILPSACHIAGRGRRQPCRRGAVFARGYTPQPARPPSLPAAATPRPHSINVVCRASYARMAALAHSRPDAPRAG